MKAQVQARNPQLVQSN